MPKLDEDDFVEPGDLPQIAQSKTPIPAGLVSNGATNATTTTTGFSTGTPTYGSPSTGGFGGGGYNSSVPAQGFATASNNNTSGQAAGAMHAGGESTVKLDKEAQDWINKKWRPVMGWVYMLTCTADFVLFPILWSLLQALSHGSVTSQWQPLTLQGAGLYHIAMGAVLGIAAYGRTKEKVEGKA
jgi:hypothetical protein